MSTSSIIVLLLSGLVIISTSNAISSQEVSNICSQVTNKNGCLTLLSDPSVAKSDLKGVGDYVLSQTRLKASATQSDLKSLVAKAKDATLKSRYGQCLDSYNDAVDDIGTSRTALKGNDKGTAETYVSAVMTYVGDCQDVWDGPPKDPSDLPKRNQDVYDTARVGLIVVHML
ncbi:hypothetical protein QQ045_019572 [Rhodiola kirilowii]